MLDQLAGLADVIRGAVLGNRDCEDKLFGLYRSYLRVTVEHEIGCKMRSRFDASDVVQLTCLEAHSNLPTFRGSTEPEFTAWISKILERKLQNELRSHLADCRNVQLEVPLSTFSDSAGLVWYEPATCESTASRRLVRGEAALRLAAAIDNLSREQAFAVRLRYLERCPIIEIAQRMGKTEFAAAGSVKRGLAALRRTLTDSFWH